ncbi:hypothetical protein F5887DRAFT_829360, partial [Amanita rubescens]
GSITGDVNARMQWKHYWRNVVKHYLVKIEGWPEATSIEGFNIASYPIDDLTSMLCKWRAGAIFWRALDRAELKDLQQSRDSLIADGKIQEPAPRRRRSDIRKKRKRRNEAGPPTKR